MVNKEQLLRSFVEGAEKGKGSNLHIDGDRLYNYRTVIAVRLRKGVIALNPHKYSQTTTINQNLLKKLALVEVEADEYDLKMSYSKN